MAVVCHFFDVGAVRHPIKHTHVAEAVLGHIFNMLLQEILPKMSPKRAAAFARVLSFWEDFEASRSFYTLFAKVTSKTTKRTS